MLMRVQECADRMRCDLSVRATYMCDILAQMVVVRCALATRNYVANYTSNKTSKSLHVQTISAFMYVPNKRLIVRTIDP